MESADFKQSYGKAFTANAASYLPGQRLSRRQFFGKAAVAGLGAPAFGAGWLNTIQPSRAGTRVIEDRLLSLGIELDKPVGRAGNICPGSNPAIWFSFRARAR